MLGQSSGTSFPLAQSYTVGVLVQGMDDRLGIGLRVPKILVHAGWAGTAMSCIGRQLRYLISQTRVS